MSNKEFWDVVSQLDGQPTICEISDRLPELWAGTETGSSNGLARKKAVAGLVLLSEHEAHSDARGRLRWAAERMSTLPEVLKQARSRSPKKRLQFLDSAVAYRHPAVKVEAAQFRFRNGNPMVTNPDTYWSLNPSCLKGLSFQDLIKLASSSVPRFVEQAISELLWRTTAWPAGVTEVAVAEFAAAAAAHKPLTGREPWWKEAATRIGGSVSEVQGMVSARGRLPSLVEQYDHIWADGANSYVAKWVFLAGYGTVNGDLASRLADMPLNPTPGLWGPSNWFHFSTFAELAEQYPNCFRRLGERLRHQPLPLLLSAVPTETLVKLLSPEAVLLNSVNVWDMLRVYPNVVPSVGEWVDWQVENNPNPVGMLSETVLWGLWPDSFVDEMFARSELLTSSALGLLTQTHSFHDVSALVDRSVAEPNTPVLRAAHMSDAQVRLLPNRMWDKLASLDSFQDRYDWLLRRDPSVPSTWGAASKWFTCLPETLETFLMSRQADGEPCHQMIVDDPPVKQPEVLAGLLPYATPDMLIKLCGSAHPDVLFSVLVMFHDLDWFGGSVTWDVGSRGVVRFWVKQVAETMRAAEQRPFLAKDYAERVPSVEQLRPYLLSDGPACRVPRFKKAGPSGADMNKFLGFADSLPDSERPEANTPDVTVRDVTCHPMLRGSRGVGNEARYVPSLETLREHWEQTRDHLVPEPSSDLWVKSKTEPHSALWVTSQTWPYSVWLQSVTAQQALLVAPSRLLAYAERNGFCSEMFAQVARSEPDITASDALRLTV